MFSLHHVYINHGLLCTSGIYLPHGHATLPVLRRLLKGLLSCSESISLVAKKEWWTFQSSYIIVSLLSFCRFLFKRKWSGILESLFREYKHQTSWCKYCRYQSQLLINETKSIFQKRPNNKTKHRFPHFNLVCFDFGNHDLTFSICFVWVRLCLENLSFNVCLKHFDDESVSIDFTPNCPGTASVST